MTKIIKSQLFLSNNWVHSLSALASRFALICDKNVEKLWGEKLVQLCKKNGLEVELLTHFSGEEHKTAQTKSDLENQLFALNFNKDTCLIALGGGVTLDLTGFIAATFCRGIKLAFIPTTLLAMVDAAIGGKNGINTSFGKNLIGTIYEPDLLLLDSYFLTTLPQKEINNGLIEMVKHGLIFSSDHFYKAASLINTPSVPDELILDSIHIKKGFVQNDLHDEGRRQSLNFGHTFAHALERLSNFAISHGEAVCIGLIIESFLSMKKNGLSKDDFMIVRSHLLPMFSKISFEHYPVKKWSETLLRDKKNQSHIIYCTLLNRIGQVDFKRPLTQEDIQLAVDYLNGEKSC
ncbi:MAG: 3-dehydroquinate synthase [Chlamydiae bacterium CG10_big_fil_rev_8_21_14_0_10_35_9]|nr:MAG: 3-dehydroquinate synthase [Chlamydiae bacterium CG10_big_fil_rev_8_21_14_0_10_35_9]